MIVCVPVTPEGSIGQSWGRAERVAIANVSGRRVVDWQEFEVGWDSLHDSGTEGSHHARVARFLREHEVEVVVANRMGAGMEHMLGKMGLEVRLGATGGAKGAVLEGLAGEPG
jgi:predicted Fe-Mo cluster-binding NifX family protein